MIPAFRVPGFTDSGFSCSGFYRFRLFSFRVLRIPAFLVPGFTDSGFSRSGFYRFWLFLFRVFLLPRSVPRFPVPCFTDSPPHCQLYANNFALYIIRCQNNTFYLTPPPAGVNLTPVEKLF